MRSITDESNFNVAHGVYAVKFWATWCQPCKIYAPTVEKLDNEFENIEFLSIDAEQVQSVVKKYKIKSLPTILILANGEEVERITGMQLIEPLRSKMREIQKKYLGEKGELATPVAAVAG